ncbi:UNVERIFIED_CONTAM: hypothetical protein HDU68_010594 [Siphonaria sp. JEL0065]|nr:hypothetical protein HDU68_010594 [Siphonaria sp. JEL0065]
MHVLDDAENIEDPVAVGKKYGLQWPLLAAGRRLLGEREFASAIRLADLAHEMNPWNRRGIVARRVTEMRWREAGLSVSELDDPSGDCGGGLVHNKSAPPSLNDVPPLPSLGSDDIGIDCSLCLNPLCDPVTLKCGHSYCRVCLLDSRQASSVCAICRTPLPSFSTLLNHPPNAILTNLVETWNASEARNEFKKEREKQLIQHANSTEFVIPLFICSLAFVGTKQQFHIFEPRYRLMVKECLDGGGVFGVIKPRLTFNPFGEQHESVGTACTIEFHESLNDEVATSGGLLPRYFVASKGVFRFRVIESNVQVSLEGLHYARVRRMDDLDPDHSSSQFDASEYAQSVLKVRKNVKTMLERIDQRRLQILIETYGIMPDDPALLSFWACQWIPVTTAKKYELMTDLDPSSRLKFIADRI